MKKDVNKKIAIDMNATDNQAPITYTNAIEYSDIQC